MVDTIQLLTVAVALHKAVKLEGIRMWLRRELNGRSTLAYGVGHTHRTDGFLAHCTTEVVVGY